MDERQRRRVELVQLIPDIVAEIVEYAELSDLEWLAEQVQRMQSELLDRQLRRHSAVFDERTAKFSAPPTARFSAGTVKDLEKASEARRTYTVYVDGESCVVCGQVLCQCRGEYGGQSGSGSG